LSRGKQIPNTSTMLFVGGSFNPIHNGHLIVARHVKETMGLTGITLIPALQSPLKSPDAQLPNPLHRLQMCQLATQGVPQFAVDDLELHRPGPSYTIETIRELARRGSEKPFWMIGADQLPYLAAWREPEALMVEARLVVVARPGFSINWQALPTFVQPLKDRVIVAPLIDISATQIRARVKGRLPIDYLTPDSVVRYIVEHALYR